jgi:hypothetical protein
VGYQSFVIRISDRVDDAYPVTADFQGVSRTGSIPDDLPLLDDREIAEAQGWLAKAFIDKEFAEDFGSRLFQTLFPLPILEMFREAEQRIAPTDNLRLVLTVPKALAGLPWELVYDAWGRHGFLARSSTAPLVRRDTNVPFPNQPPKKGPLRVLVVTAQPEGTGRLSAERETEEIVAALGREPSIRKRLRTLWMHLKKPRTLPSLLRRLHQGQRFQVAEPLHNATKAKLQERMVRAKEDGEGYHVIHFVGHGYTDAGGAKLLLEKDGQVDPIEAKEFAEMIGERTVNLVVLNACETASASTLFQSIAQAVLKRGVPAVIGMQVAVLDSVAVDFGREFYRLWAAGEPIEGALAHARRLIQRQSPGAASDWSIPVLYTGLTPGLTLEPLERVSRALTATKFLSGAFGAIIAILGAIMALLAVPATHRTIRTELWPIRCVWPWPMDENKFTVAFNTFSVVDEEGAPIWWSRDGRALAGFLYQRFEHDFEELDLPIPYELRPPAHTCAIWGRTPDERAANAADRAEQIQADVIVYGVITKADDDPRFALEFSVNYHGFDEAEEIAGPHALGGSLPIDLPFRPNSLQNIEHPPHLVRTDILSLIAVGLSYYSADNMERALEFFQEAEQHEHWPRTDGKEIIYLLLGNATLRQASLQASSEALSEAYGLYQQALSVNKDYVRAMLGQASALYLQALIDPQNANEKTIDPALLEEAEDTYNEAFARALVLGNHQIEPKVHFGLGQIYLARAAGGEDVAAWLDQAKSEFEWLKTEHDERGNDRIRTRAAHAYRYLAGLAFDDDEIDLGLEYYRAAIELASPFYKGHYLTRLGDVYCRLDNPKAAVDAYQDAVDTARLWGFRDKVEQYAAKLESLERDGCPARTGP